MTMHLLHHDFIRPSRKIGHDRFDRQSVAKWSSHELALAVSADATATAVAFAAASSLVARLMNAQGSVRLGDLRSRLTPSMALLQLARHSGNSSALSSTAIFRCVDFYSALESAVDVLEKGWSRERQSEPHAGQDMAAALSLWRFAAGAGVRMLDEIRHSHILDPSIAELITIVSAALVVVRDASSSPLGEHAANRTSNQRRARRYILNSPAIVTHDTRKIRAVVVDISTGGVGLKNVIHVIAGDRVTIHMRDRPVLSGTITWVRGINAGVKFDTPLTNDHPLIRALR